MISPEMMYRLIADNQKIKDIDFLDIYMFIKNFLYTYKENKHCIYSHKIMSYLKQDNSIAISAEKIHLLNLQ